METVVTRTTSRVSAMHGILDRPVNRTGRLLLLAAILLLLLGGVLPLWRISLVAPQYAEGLTLDMYAYQIVAGNKGQDLAEINTLNHYIGMKPIAQADFLEMKVLPFAIGVFALLGLRSRRPWPDHHPCRSRPCCSCISACSRSAASLIGSIPTDTISIHVRR